MLRQLLRRVFSHGKVDALLAQASACDAAGDIEAAQRRYRKVLSRHPDHPEALRRLGSLLGRAGRLVEARTWLEGALKREPGSSPALASLANVCWLQGQTAEAERLYRAAIAADPGSVDAFANLGWLYWRESRQTEAIEAFLRALALEPRREGLLDSVSRLLVETKRPEEAWACCERVGRDGRDDVEWHAACARALHALCRYPEALQHCERSGVLAGNDAALLTDAARTLQELGQVALAADTYDRAIALKPEDPTARWHRALLRLQLGDYAEGWNDYAMRLLSQDRPSRVARARPWDGERMDGRDILVYGEQGLGDEIMFASCVPDLVKRARHVFLEVSPRLEPLMAQSFPQARVFAAGADGVPSRVAGRNLDFEVPIGSLPGVFRRSLGAFPSRGGYLRADPSAVAAWRTRLAGLGPGLKIGLSWRGGTLRTRQPLRSIPLQQLVAVLNGRDAHGVSLQYGDVSAEVEAAAAQGIDVAHWPEAIVDFGQMAALMSALDLVISVCNTTVHLAGALGRPVWVMAPRMPEWRYGVYGETMPWYPSARVWRQSVYGDWKPVLKQVAEALQGDVAAGVV